MSPSEIAHERKILVQWVDAIQAFRSAESFSKENFLRDAWRMMSGFVHHNKSNPLIQASVRRYPDLIPRAFSILTILYGAFSIEPGKRSMLVDFVHMLGDDLVEAELNACAYAKSKRGRSFFSELSWMLEGIRDVYGAEHFRLEVLPPTPHHAYVLIVLNKSELLGKHMSNAELFGYLSVYDSMMRRAFELIDGSRNPNPPIKSRRED